MLHSISPTWLFSGWFAAVALAVTWSVTMDARLSTSALLLVIGLAPAVVMLLLRAGAPSATVAQMLHSTHEKGDR